MIDILSRSGWLSAKEICIRKGLTPSEANRRIVRSFAEESEGKVISGQEGYKLTAEATAEEIHHAAAWLRAQATKMLSRASSIEAVYAARKNPQGDLFLTQTGGLKCPNP